MKLEPIVVANYGSWFQVSREAWLYLFPCVTLWFVFWMLLMIFSLSRLLVGVLILGFLMVLPPAAFAGQAVLSWFSSDAQDLAGYVLYYKDNSNNFPLTKTRFTRKIILSANQLSFTMEDLSEGAHDFALTAFDDSSNESALSVVVRKMILAEEVVLSETGSSQPNESSSGGGSGGGCGRVSPMNRNALSGPQDAAGMLAVVGSLALLFIKKNIKTLATKSRDPI